MPVSPILLTVVDMGSTTLYRKITGGAIDFVPEGLVRNRSRTTLVRKTEDTINKPATLSGRLFGIEARKTGLAGQYDKDWKKYQEADDMERSHISKGCFLQSSHPHRRRITVQFRVRVSIPVKKEPQDLRVCV